MNYNHFSHTHCWDQYKIHGFSACNIPLEKHKQCCLCDLTTPPEKPIDANKLMGELHDEIDKPMTSESKKKETMVTMEYTYPFNGRVAFNGIPYVPETLLSEADQKGYERGQESVVITEDWKDLLRTEGYERALREREEINRTHVQVANDMGYKLGFEKGYIEVIDRVKYGTSITQGPDDDHPTMLVTSEFIDYLVNEHLPDLLTSLSSKATKDNKN